MIALTIFINVTGIVLWLNLLARRLESLDRLAEQAPENVALKDI